MCRVWIWPLFIYGLFRITSRSTIVQPYGDDSRSSHLLAKEGLISPSILSLIQVICGDATTVQYLTLA